MSKDTVKVSLIVLVSFLLIDWLIGCFMKYGFINGKNDFRGCDVHGCGEFGADRIGHKHKGVDIKCIKDTVVYAPFDCEFVRTGVAYNDDTTYKLIVLKGLGRYCFHELKIIYMYPSNFVVGEKITKGSKIGVCQSISEKFSIGMIDHLHVELKQNGVLKDPTKYLI